MFKYLSPSNVKDLRMKISTNAKRIEEDKLLTVSEDNKNTGLDFSPQHKKVTLLESLFISIIMDRYAHFRLHSKQ